MRGRNSFWRAVYFGRKHWVLIAIAVLCCYGIWKSGGVIEWPDIFKFSNISSSTWRTATPMVPTSFGVTGLAAEVRTETPTVTASVVPTAIPSEAPTVEPTSTTVPTVEVNPSVETVELPVATATSSLALPRVFDRTTTTRDMQEGESQGCIEGKVNANGAIVVLSFQMADDFRIVELPSNSIDYKICDMPVGIWASAIFTLNSEPFHDSDSTQNIEVVEGKVTTANWRQTSP